MVFRNYFNTNRVIFSYQSTINGICVKYCRNSSGVKKLKEVFVDIPPSFMSKNLSCNNLKIIDGMIL